MQTVTLETLYKDMESIKRDIKWIKAVLESELELSEETKKELKEARSEHFSEYVKHEDVKKEFLG
jgi:hypothetical protein